MGKLGYEIWGNWDSTCAIHQPGARLLHWTMQTQDNAVPLVILESPLAPSQGLCS